MRVFVVLLFNEFRPIVLPSPQKKHKRKKKRKFHAANFISLRETGKGEILYLTPPKFSVRSPNPKRGWLET